MIPIIAVSLLIFLLLIGMSFLFVASDNILDEGDENWYDNKTNREESQG